MALAAILTTINAQAQKLIVLDNDGNTIPYATIMTPEAEMIGTTNLEGVFETNGRKELVITHVAFKAKRVKMGDADATITLEDADFDMPEITISPKPYIYVQTFYRMYYYSSDDGIIYYRAGLTDNVYDLAKKTVSSKTEHMAKAKYGILKTILGMFGSRIDRQGHISARKVEDRMKDWGKAVQLKITETAPGKKLITDCKGTIGTITDDMSNHQRHFAYDSHQIFLHKLEAEGNTKKLEKRKKRDEEKQNRTESDFHIYHIDDSGNYAPEDFVMSQNLSSWDEVKDDKTEHVIIAIQAFNTERAFVTKDELKQRKKANKMKMKYANVRQFERDHHIPPLEPAVQKKLDELAE